MVLMQFVKQLAQVVIMPPIMPPRIRSLWQAAENLIFGHLVHLVAEKLFCNSERSTWAIGLINIGAFALEQLALGTPFNLL